MKRCSEQSAASPKHRYAQLWPEAALGLLCVAMFLLRLGAGPISSPDEGRYALIAREMVERNDWIVPHINGVLYFEKPPLFYWLTALCIRLLGATALAARLPSAAAGIATVWILYALGRRMGGRAVGLASAAVAATSLGLVVMAHQVMLDMLLTCLIAAAMACFWLYGGSLRNTQYAILLWLALALAVLDKGFVGLLLPVAAMLAYAWWARDRERLRALPSVPGILLFLAITVPWHAAAALREPEFVWFYFVNEHLLRFLGRRLPMDYQSGSFATPIAGALLLLLPWSALLPAALARAWKSRHSDGRRVPEDLFLVCWLAVPLLFFLVARTRTPYYLLPVVPPAALLAGRLWSDLRRRAPDGVLRAWLLVPLAVTLAAVAAAGIRHGFSAGEDPSQTEILLMGAASALPLAAGLVAAAAGALAGRHRAVFPCVAAAGALTWCAGLLLPADGSRAVSERAQAQTVRRLDPPADAVVAVEGRVEQLSSFAFYLPRRLRPVVVVDGRTGGDMEFGSRYRHRPGLFVSGCDLPALAGQRPLYYLTSDPPRSPVPPALQVVSRRPGTLLWANPAAVRSAAVYGRPGAPRRPDWERLTRRPPRAIMAAARSRPRAGAVFSPTCCRARNTQYDYARYTPCLPRHRLRLPPGTAGPGR